MLSPLVGHLVHMLSPLVGHCTHNTQRTPCQPTAPQTHSPEPTFPNTLVHPTTTQSRPLPIFPQTPWCESCRAGGEGSNTLPLQMQRTKSGTSVPASLLVHRFSGLRCHEKPSSKACCAEMGREEGAQYRCSMAASPGPLLPRSSHDGPLVHRTLPSATLRVETFEFQRRDMDMVFASTLRHRGLAAPPGVGKQVVLFRFLTPDERHKWVDVERFILDPLLGAKDELPSRPRGDGPLPNPQAISHWGPYFAFGEGLQGAVGLPRFEPVGPSGPGCPYHPLLLVRPALDGMAAQVHLQMILVREDKHH